MSVKDPLYTEKNKIVEALSVSSPNTNDIKDNIVKLNITGELYWILFNIKYSLSLKRNLKKLQLYVFEDLFKYYLVLIFGQFIFNIIIY